MRAKTADLNHTSQAHCGTSRFSVPARVLTSPLTDSGVFSQSFLLMFSSILLSYPALRNHKVTIGELGTMPTWTSFNDGIANRRMKNHLATLRGQHGASGAVLVPAQVAAAVPE